MTASDPPVAADLEEELAQLDQDGGYPRRVQELLGYSIHPPFMGHVDGLHPARLIDPEYGERDRVDARRATEVLVPPT